MYGVMYYAVGVLVLLMMLMMLVVDAGSLYISLATCCTPSYSVVLYSMLLVMGTTTPRTTRSDVVDAATRGGDVGSDRYHASYSVLRTLLVVVLLVVLVVYCSCPVVCCAPLVLLLIVLWDYVLTTCPRYKHMTYRISIPIFGPTRIVWSEVQPYLS